MLRLRHVAIVLMFVAAKASLGQPTNVEPVGAVLVGERIDAAQFGPGVVESMEDVIARDLLTPRGAPWTPKARNGRPGEWKVPSAGATYYPKGKHNVTNRWGDTRMGIAFGEPVNVNTVLIGGQAARGAWARAVRVVGYLGGRQVAETPWYRELEARPKELAIGLDNVDRIVFEAEASFRGAGWYGLDDLTYTTRPRDPADQAATRVVDFEDCSFGDTLTGTGYAGLVWETGTGEFNDAEQPDLAALRRAAAEAVPPVSARGAAGDLRGGGAMPPTVTRSFEGVRRGDAGEVSYPPDTCGAVGPSHFVVAVNRNFAVFDKVNGVELTNVSFDSFLPGSIGDPRVLYDQHSNRWIIINTDFSARIYLAISTSSNANGSYFKTDFITSIGGDAGCPPDYPTLGVDANGIYTSAFMTGGCFSMSIFAIDKAPLLTGSPALGAVTAFRNLPFEGAIQPVHTYGTPATPGQYFVSLSGSSARIRRLTGPLTSPSLATVANVVLPGFGFPPDVPAMGSATALDSVDTRLMNAVYRGESIWTAHSVAAGVGTGVRWYELDETPTFSLAQSGTIDSPSRSYWMPSVAVNANGDAIVGFSGSNSTEFAGAYFSGRLAGDTPGQMSAPVLFKAGTASHNLIDQFGRNRWGDYSLCTLDPEDEIKLWTIQEYVAATDIWGTWIARLEFGPPDTLAPAPDPPSFEIPPAPVSPTAIQMMCEEVTDPSSPVQYMFNFVGGGSGGSSSAWINPRSFNDSGLSANTTYDYTVQARDSAFPTPNVGAPSAVATGCTMIQTPLNVGTSFTGETEIGVVAAGQISNLAVGMSGLYFEQTPPDGSGGNTWIQTVGTTLTGLTPGTNYTIRVKARNQFGLETPLTAPVDVRTFGCACPGDADGDGTVNGHDVEGFIRYWLGIFEPNDNPDCAFFGNFTLEEEIDDFVSALLAPCK